MGVVQARPVSPSALVDHLTALILERVAATPDARLRVAVDGAPSARPGELADALVAPLRAAGRPAVRVRADDFLRPASLRFELGRRDADAYYADRLDRAALEREVLDPFGSAGAAEYLPTLWDAERDRATRARYEPVPAGGVLVLDGSLLLGRWLELDLTIHLAQRLDSVERRTPEEDRWTLPAFARYAEEVGPELVADVVVRVDDPRHPALVLPD
ncbi:MAG TPA: uridine kinase [Actinotalea sp.]|jgi:hypothetical protein